MKVTPYTGHRAAAKLDEAARALREVLALPAGDLTVAAAASLGNRASFALRIINGDTNIDEQTIKVTIGTDTPEQGPAI